MVEEDARFCIQLFSHSHTQIIAIQCSQGRQQLMIYSPDG